MVIHEGGSGQNSKVSAVQMGCRVDETLNYKQERIRKHPMKGMGGI